MKVRLCSLSMHTLSSCSSIIAVSKNLQRKVWVTVQQVGLHQVEKLTTVSSWRVQKTCSLRTTTMMMRMMLTMKQRRQQRIECRAGQLGKQRPQQAIARMTVHNF